MYCHKTAVGCQYIEEMSTIMKIQPAQKNCTNSFCIHDRSPYNSCRSNCAFDDETRLRFWLSACFTWPSFCCIKLLWNIVVYIFKANVTLKFKIFSCTFIMLLVGNHCTNSHSRYVSITLGFISVLHVYGLFNDVCSSNSLSLYGRVIFVSHCE